MTNKRSTKRALLLSALSLLMCVSMLVGSTFAWFTDSVTSGNNIIKSGTLDVTMEWAEGTTDPATTTWKNAADGAIFNYDKWEPGYTEVRHIKIANVGTLALKYQLNIVANGEVSELTDVIDVYYVDPAIQVAERTVFTEDMKLGTLAEVLAAISTTASGNLEAGKDHTITLALKMQESAGNEYQGLSIGSEFSVQVMATQLTAEIDSFDKEYDAEATYLNQDTEGAWLINNMDELFFFASQVNGGNNYKGQTVKLTADIDLDGYNWTPIGAGDVNGTWIGFDGIFDGQNHTVSNIKVTKGGGWNGFFGLVGRGTTTVKESISNLKLVNVEIEGTNRMTGALVGQIYGNVENCHVENVEISAVPNWIGTEYDNGDKIGGIVGWHGDNGDKHFIKNCTAKNVTLKAYRDVGGITGYIGSSSTVENCAVDTVAITVDQATNHYGAKATNAGGIVGRIAADPVIVQNNTEKDVSVDDPTAQGYSVVYIQNLEDFTAFGKAVNDNAAYNGVNVANNDNVWVELISDIDMTDAPAIQGTEFAIGNGSNLLFTGVFDGNGHTISNYHIEASWTYNVSLFRTVSGNFTMKDITFDNCSASKPNNRQSSILVGTIGGGTITFDNVDIKNSTVNGVAGSAAYAGNVTEGAIYFIDCEATNVTLNSTSATGRNAMFLGDGYSHHDYEASGVWVEGCTITDCQSTVNGVADATIAEYHYVK